MNHALVSARPSLARKFYELRADPTLIATCVRNCRIILGKYLNVKLTTCAPAFLDIPYPIT